MIEVAIFCVGDKRATILPSQKIPFDDTVKNSSMPRPLTFAFTLIELSVVVMIMALLAAAALRYSTAIKDSNNVIAVNASLDTVEAALLNYRIAYGRLPCPADLTQSENSANGGLTNFGTEIETLADGNCAGIATNNYINSGADPDGDAAAQNNIVAGAIPNKALKLPDQYAYDPWGRKILYVIDKRMTAANSFIANPVTVTGTTAQTPGAIEIKYNYTDTLANAITSKAVYALVSFGKNGHGGYVRNLTATPVRYNAASTNHNEWQNCHCNSSAAATAFDRIFIQNTKTAGSTAITDTFDDIVRFKTRAELSAASEMP